MDRFKNALQNYEGFLIKNLLGTIKSVIRVTGDERDYSEGLFFKNALTFEGLFEVKTLMSLRIRHHYLEKGIDLKYN